MTDTAPLLFAPRMGGLFPASQAAEKALRALDASGPVKVAFKRTRGNQGRMSLYWVVLAKAAPMLSEMCEGDAIDETMLHRILKDRRGLYTQTILPSGEVVKNYDSISFHKMPENERAEYVDWAFNTLAKWLRVDVMDLTAND